jgi:hypothetical protein
MNLISASFPAYNAVPVAPQRKILIALPTYTGMVTAETMIAMVGARHEAHARGWACDITVLPGDSVIQHARNVMLARFLRSGADDLVFWDHDVVCSTGDFLRLLSHPVEFVAGAYRYRSDPEGYSINLLAGAEIDPVSRLLEIYSIAGGFMRITRAAVERMVAAEPDAWVEDKENGRIPWIFDVIRKGHALWGEDHCFCDKFRATGGRIWLDTSIRLAHVGSKAYTGDWVAHIMAQPRRFGAAA